MFELTVISDFGGYRRGDKITDSAEVDRILSGEMAAHVVKVIAAPKPAEPTPARSFNNAVSKDAAQD